MDTHEEKVFCKKLAQLGLYRLLAEYASALDKWHNSEYEGLHELLDIRERVIYAINHA